MQKRRKGRVLSEATLEIKYRDSKKTHRKCFDILEYSLSPLTQANIWSKAGKIQLYKQTEITKAK
jgi:hypothetical protein